MITREEWKDFRGSKKTPDHIMLSVKGNACTDMGVTWRCSTDVTDGHVSVRKKGVPEDKRFDAVFEPYRTDLDESNYFWADVTGLEPDTEYEYTCGSESDRSELFSFKTAPLDCEDFEFLILADTQHGDAEPPADYTEYGEIVSEILRLHPNIRFILVAGDNTNCGGTDIQWCGLLDGLKGVIEHVPYMMSVGNHDDMMFSSYFTKEGKYYSDQAIYFYSQFKHSYNFNGPKDWEVANYSFDYGNAHFTTIGTSGQEYLNPWIINDAESSDKTWKFAMNHFPICYNGSDLSNCDNYPVIMEGIEKFDVVFAGHEHSFSRSYPRKDNNLYKKPSQGTIHYELGSGFRNPPGTKCVPKVWNAFCYEHEVYLSMYSVAHVKGKTLTIKAYLEGDVLVDEVTIDKENDVILPVLNPPKFLKTRVFFKGMELGIMGSINPCQLVDGHFMIPPAVLFRAIGVDVQMSPGAVTVNGYGHTAIYRENSDEVETDRGILKSACKISRLNRGQLFADIDSLCEPFDLFWSYYDENNFISIETENENAPLPAQP